MVTLCYEIGLEIGLALLLVSWLRCSAAGQARTRHGSGTEFLSFFRLITRSQGGGMEYQAVC
jgi:hypothetical protein